MTTGNDAILAANYASDNEITLLIDSLPTVTQQQYKQLLKLAKSYVGSQGVSAYGTNGYFVPLKKEGYKYPITYTVWPLKAFVTKTEMKEWFMSFDENQLYLFLKGMPYTKTQWMTYLKNLDKQIRTDPSFSVLALPQALEKQFVDTNRIDYAKMKQVILNDWPSFVGVMEGIFVKFSINNRIYIVET